jgi:hypothetical protein
MDNFFRVNRVKQHLARSHAEPDVYCERCKTVFQDEDSHQRHLQEIGPACVFQPWDPGHRLITRRQQSELRKKSTAISEAERWFAVWHIIFPGHPPPPSPYIDIGLSDTLRHFREYATGPRVEIALRAAGLHDFDLLRCAPEVVSRAIGVLVDGFALSRASPNRSPGQSESSRSERFGQAANTSPFADSGVALSSQHVEPPAPEHTSWVGPATPQQASFEERQASLARSAVNFANYQPGAINANLDTRDDIPFSVTMLGVGADIDGNEPVVPSSSGEGISAESQMHLVGDYLGENLGEFPGFGDNHELWDASEGGAVNQELFERSRTPEFSTLSPTYWPQPGAPHQ